MNFGVLVFNQVEELDFVGPWEMLTMWSKNANGSENCIIVSESLNPIICAKLLSINPHVVFATCPPLDYLLVPGGLGTRQAVNDTTLVGFVANQAKNCRAVLSVCTGCFVLHAAGLLSGKRHTYEADLEFYGPRYQPDSDASVVEYAFPSPDERDPKSTRGQRRHCLNRPHR